jgi:hypothetical protein
MTTFDDRETVSTGTPNVRVTVPVTSAWIALSAHNLTQHRYDFAVGP